MRRPSGTSDTPRRTTFSVANAVRGRPSKRMAPACGASSPAIVSSVVDLPAPLGPTMHTISPAATSRSIPRTAASRP